MRTPHNQERWGFSMETMIFRVQHTYKKATAFLYSRLAWLTFVRLMPLKPGKPIKCSALRRGGGSLKEPWNFLGSCFSLALLQVPHGKPMCTAKGRSCFNIFDTKSFEESVAKSSDTGCARVLWRLCAWSMGRTLNPAFFISADNAADPAQNSTK